MFCTSKVSYFRVIANTSEYETTNPEGSPPSSNLNDGLNPRIAYVRIDFMNWKVNSNLNLMNSNLKITSSLKR